MLWYVGYNTKGVKSLAGPFQDKTSGEALTVNWKNTKVYEINTSDRNEAIREIFRQTSTLPAQPPRPPEAPKEDKDPFGLGNGSDMLNF